MNDLGSSHIRASRITNKIPKSVKGGDILTTVKWKEFSYKRRLINLHFTKVNNIYIIAEIKTSSKRRSTLEI